MSQFFCLGHSKSLRTFPKVPPVSQKEIKIIELQMHLALAYLTQDKNILSQHFLLYVIECIYFLKCRTLFKNFQMKKTQLGITEDKRKQSTYTSVNKKAYSCVVLRWIKNINYLQHFCLKTLRLYKK
jgi:hypothetical protein